MVFDGDAAGRHHRDLQPGITFSILTALQFGLGCFSRPAQSIYFTGSINCS